LILQKYGSATKATREVPVIKYAKKLSNQVLRVLKLLPTTMDGKRYTLREPDELERVKRYYIEVTDLNGEVICENDSIVTCFSGISKHLAA
jgi:hypothetical protein